ncbi:hypothetical protein OG689_38920 [Kitasatospora sp. NBC_00240]|uniref:hypothetical protein n=1 Tax=Kitasatospora sp. NBC_00240 TaxID=2903567 RepID=UPI002259FEB0|nr:hypothetical protein [Kitasatospora sp. NBC_00240]MCX5215169.1 hypothetical protein [Kitasatospora sp. NBC_00240]
MGVLDIVVAVGLVALLLRALVRRGPTPGPLLLALVFGGLGLWRGFGPGPGWLLWPAVVLLTVTAGDFLLAARLNSRMPHTDSAEVKAELLTDCRSDGGRQQLTLAVAPGGAVMLDGVWRDAVRRDAVMVTAGCPVCLVEEVTAELAGPEAQALAAYRRDRAAGTNRLVVLSRRGDDWEAALEPVRASSKPFRPVDCPVHR